MGIRKDHGYLDSDPQLKTMTHRFNDFLLRYLPHNYHNLRGFRLGQGRFGDVQEWQILRHTDIKTTFRYYVHTYVSGRSSDTKALTRAFLLADVPQALLAGTGVFTRNHAHIRDDLLALTLRFIAHLLALICPNRARNHTTFDSHDTSSNAAISAKQRTFVSPIKNSRLT
jgi:hypothetical protein